MNLNNCVELVEVNWFLKMISKFDTKIDDIICEIEELRSNPKLSIDVAKKTRELFEKIINYK